MSPSAHPRRNEPIVSKPDSLYPYCFATMKTNSVKSIEAVLPARMAFGRATVEPTAVLTFSTVLLCITLLNVREGALISALICFIVVSKLSSRCFFVACRTPLAFGSPPDLCSRPRSLAKAPSVSRRADSIRSPLSSPVSAFFSSC